MEIFFSGYGGCDVQILGIHPMLLLETPVSRRLPITAVAGIINHADSPRMETHTAIRSSLSAPIPSAISQVATTPEEGRDRG